LGDVLAGTFVCAFESNIIGPFPRNLGFFAFLSVAGLSEKGEGKIGGTMCLADLEPCNSES
jgi:hypothetical protein